MSKFIGLFCLLFFSLSVKAQLNLFIEKTLPVPDQKRDQLTIYPTSLQSELTNLQFFKSGGRYESASFDTLKDLPKSSNVIKVSQYFKEGVWKSRKGVISGSFIDHRSLYPAILYKDVLYVFSGNQIDADTKVFNLLLEKIDLRIKNESDAKGLSNFYFALTRNYFTREGKYILSEISDIPSFYRERNPQKSEELSKIIESPKITKQDNGFEVVLYTWEISYGEVRKWKIRVGSNAKLTVKSDLAGKI
jgi:hypothetical protein